MLIGERLIAEGLVTADHVEEALRSQVVQGGRLGTNLIEAFGLDIDVLAEALARHHDMPAALQRHFDRCDPKIQALLKPELAAKWHAVPLGQLTETEIAVAVTDPLPADGLIELSGALGQNVVPAVAPELRVLYHLERIYGVKRLNRFLRMPRPDNRPDERRHYAHTLEDSTPVEIPSQLARIAIRRIALPASGEIDLPDALTTIEGTIKATRRAQTRSRLGRIIVKALRVGWQEQLTAAVIFVIRGGYATGWKGYVRGGDEDVIDALAVPLDAKGVLAAPFAERAPRLVSNIDASSIDGRMWNTLGVAKPTNASVVPVILGDHVVSLMYAQWDGERQEHIHNELIELGEALASSFGRLIKAANR